MEAAAAAVAGGIVDIPSAFNFSCIIITLEWGFLGLARLGGGALRGEIWSSWHDWALQVVHWSSRRTLVQGSS